MTTKNHVAARTQWAFALIKNLVQSGRAAGWLAGPGIAGEVDSDAMALEFASASGDTSAPLDVLAQRLRLETMELDLLWLLAAIELDPMVASASQFLLPRGMNELSAQLLERLIGRGQPLAEDVFERLQALALIDCDPQLPLHRRPVRIHARVVDLARGQLRLDPQLQAFARLEHAIEIRRGCDDIDVTFPSELRGVIASSDRSLMIAVGNEGSGRSTLIRHAISSIGRSVLTVNVRALSADDSQFAHQLRCIRRECQLHDAWPLLIGIDGVGARESLLDRELLAPIDSPVFSTACEVPSLSCSRSTVTVRVDLPDAAAREDLWRRALPAVDPSILRGAAHRYSISPDLIGKAAAAAVTLADGGGIALSHIHSGLRTHLERRLVGTARRIETKQTWDDLVIPLDQFDLVLEMIARVRHRQRVLDQWGFADKVGRGLGLSALLSGPPGTGKTMIAGLVAQELGLDLFQVDLSKVVSKYIGETEKQLATLFEAAESGHVILLFDEADSLFAKRTDVSSSNDRYANLKVNYLLQRIEAFSGITIMTTNHETAIDHAFQRRLAFHIRVPMPDESHRELIWRSMLPEKADRTDDLDFAKLAANFEMSGGYIKNAMLRAAFLCAAEGTAISGAQLWRAAQAEYEAMGKISYQAQYATRAL